MVDTYNFQSNSNAILIIWGAPRDIKIAILHILHNQNNMRKKLFIADSARKKRSADGNEGNVD